MENMFSREKIQMYERQAREYASRSMPYKEETQNTDILERFINEHPGRGILKIQVTSGNSDFPIEGAEIKVFKEFENEWLLIYTNKTDESGILDNLTLPALPASLSQIEETAKDGATTYVLTVTHPQYEESTEQNTQIYDRVKTILPVALQPKII